MTSLALGLIGSILFFGAQVLSLFVQKYVRLLESAADEAFRAVLFKGRQAESLPE